MRIEDLNDDWEIIEGNVGDQCYYANDVVSANTSISWLVLDEFAFVPPNQATEFFEAVYPTISSGEQSKVSIFSTPKGMNHFYKMWIEASEGRSEFAPYEINWNDVPGRDEAWKEKTIANIGQESWEQEFEACLSGDSKVEILDERSGKIYKLSLKNLFHISSENIPKEIYDELSTLHLLDRMDKTK